METDIKLVVFQLSEQQYALPLSVVERVIHAIEIRPLLKMPTYLHGIINLNGEIVPVINIRILFGIADKELQLTDQLIIVNSINRKFALLVDSTQEVIEVKESEVIKSDKIFYGVHYIHGVIKLEQGIVLINDVEKFLCQEELERLETVLKEEALE